MLLAVLVQSNIMLVNALPTYNLVLEAAIAAPSCQVKSVFVGDVDNDGVNELITGEGNANNPGVVRIFEFDEILGTYEESWNHQLIDDSTTVWGIAVGDVDDDGLNELVFSSRDHNVYVYEYNGVSYDLVWSAYVGDVPTVTIGDVDNDENNEIIVSALSGGTYIFDYVGGTDIFHEVWHLDGTDLIWQAENCVVDLDNDGDNELIIRGLEATKIFESMDDLVPYEITYNSGSWGKGSLAVDDVDEDGENELLIGEYIDDDYKLNVYDFDTDHFDLLWESNFGADNGAAYLGFFVGDVNNDGDVEIVFQDRVFKFEDNTFQQYTIDMNYNSIYGHPVVIADVDGDLKNEWITQANGIGIKVFSLVPSGDVLPPTITITAPEIYGVYPADSGLFFDFSATDDNLVNVDATIALLGETSTDVENGDAFPNDAGVYTLTITATDSAGNSQTEDRTFVIYDASAGFVTGGGWIMSPAGAYTTDSSLEGKATFGFVSKYKKGASVPTGNTEFIFNAAGFKFSSTSYDWLVIAGTKAMFKGEGMINGEGNYNFMLTANDGGETGVDTFRMKIWETDGDDDSVIYDNKIDTELGGGSIIVHKK